MVAEFALQALASETELVRRRKRREENARAAMQAAGSDTDNVFVNPYSYLRAVLANGMCVCACSEWEKLRFTAYAAQRTLYIVADNNSGRVHSLNPIYTMVHTST